MQSWIDEIFDFMKGTHWNLGMEAIFLDLKEKKKDFNVVWVVKVWCYSVQWYRGCMSFFEAKNCEIMGMTSLTFIPVHYKSNLISKTWFHGKERNVISMTTAAEL